MGLGGGGGYFGMSRLDFMHLQGPAGLTAVNLKPYVKGLDAAVLRSNGLFGALLHWNGLGKGLGRDRVKGFWA